MPDELSPRHLALRVAQIAAVIAVGAVAISALPGLDEVRQRLAGTEPVWVAALVLAELGSCAGYVLVFTFVLTGTLPDLSREEATKLIRRAGGKVTGWCRRAPTTWSPATAPARSSPRPRSWAST